MDYSWYGVDDCGSCANIAVDPTMNPRAKIRNAIETYFVICLASTKIRNKLENNLNFALHRSITHLPDSGYLARLNRQILA